MYQRKSKLQTLLILSADCVCIFFSLILANYIRNKRLFESDNARMDFGISRHESASEYQPEYVPERTAA